MEVGPGTVFQVEGTEKEDHDSRYILKAHSGCQGVIWEGKTATLFSTMKLDQFIFTCSLKSVNSWNPRT